MLIVVRHGRTEANAAGRLLGRGNPGLDELGRRQAQALGAVVAGASRVVCSPLLRTQETAAAIGLPITVDERWIELDYGALEGAPFRDLPPETLAQWMSDPEFAPAGGESIAALGVRVRSACDDLADEAAERDIVVVSHVSPVKAAVAWALGVGDEITWRLYVAPASVTKLAVGPTRRSLHLFNAQGHLDGIE